MSEGEKKKLLVKATFDIVGTENSLILMDEPDAHLHIVAKNYFYNLANAEEFIKNLKQIGIPDNKKIIVLFDKDKGGFDGIRSCLKACRTNENINLGQIDCNDNHIYKNKNFYYLTYPKTQNCLASAEFVLEDYFTITTKAIRFCFLSFYTNLDISSEKSILWDRCR